jgi:diguanylate cyclase (GGDEF)-like protein/PAS domain S-box-containing protein
MKENILRLLIVEDSSNDAEAIINIVRRAGYGVRLERVHNRETMQTALKGQVLDVILCASNLAEFSVQQALALLKKADKDISFIVLADTSPGPLTVEFLNAGARDVVSKDQIDLLQLVIVREFKALEERREHRHCLKALRETEKRCRSLIDSSRDAIAYVHDGMHTYANAIYLRMFGYPSADELEGTPIMDMVAPADHARFKEFLRTYIVDEETTKELEVNGLHTDKSIFSAMMKFSPASIDGETCTQIIIQDLSPNQEFEDKIKTLSQHDLLTGLYNRQYFLAELESAVASAAAGSGNSVLLYIQMDDFYSIQEAVGVAVSDLVLRDIAALLRTLTDESNTLAYFSNDVFTVVMRDKDVEYAQQVAENIRNAMENSFYDAAGQSVTTTCRITIGLIADYLLSSKAFLSEINKTSRAFRSIGANKVHLYSPDADVRSAKAKLQEQVVQIHTALSNDQFRLLYQPIANLHGLSGEMYQVLARMLDENGNEIESSKFLHAAEHVGLAAAIDRWIITHAVEILAAKRRAGSPMTFFIKLFENTLKDESLLKWLSELIKTERLEADSLVFEVSERVVMSNLKEARAFIKGLNELHGRFCLSHFGGNSNSLLQLKNLPTGIHYLKIDASFQINLSTQIENQTAVKSINETARSLGILTIAEGVEDAGSLSLLWQFGVNYIQGYYLQKPSETLDFDFSENG